MKIGLVGGSREQRSLPFDGQRTINLYPVFDEEGKEVSALYGTPGLQLFAVVGTGPIRGEFSATNGRAFTVSGSGLYEVDGAGNSTLRGSLEQSQGIVYIAENGQQLGICDGKSLYMLRYDNNDFQKVIDPDLPEIGTLDFIDGYFVATELRTGRFWISALYNGLAWAPLDFATAESSPDNLRRAIGAVGLLWPLGDLTGEAWSNTGDATFPFERISGGKLSVGIASPATALELDESLFWVGNSREGRGIVYRASGFKPQRISTSFIERKLQAVPNMSLLTAYAYQQEGHTFYVVTGEGLETTLVYDLTTKLWHERSYFNEQGQHEPHLGSCCMVAFNKTLVGDRRNGNIYEMSLDYYSDNGEEIAADRIYTHISDEGAMIRFSSLEIGVEPGVGTQTGAGVDPKIMLRLSKDGCKTYTDWYSTDIGKVGHYKNKARFRRLGTAPMMTFHMRITAPVRRAICGSYLN